MIAGPALVVLALFLWLLGTHFREGRWFDRPDFARHLLFDPTLAVVRWGLLAAGLAILWRAAPTLAVSVAMLLIALATWRRLAQSVWIRARFLRRRLAALRDARTGMPEREALRMVILERHPEWGDELVEQMILDYRTPDAIARVMARMERGFRGFS